VDETSPREEGERDRAHAEKGEAQPVRTDVSKDPVDEAEEESFPASDPPATTPLKAGPPRHEPHSGETPP
jgi:hypothetical protein